MAGERSPACLALGLLRNPGAVDDAATRTR
jgi:hypothetical protein